MLACKLERLKIFAPLSLLLFVDTMLYKFLNIPQVGDPLEKAALKGIDWSYKSDEKAVPKR